MQLIKIEQFIYGRVFDTGVRDGRFGICASSLPGTVPYGPFHAATKIGANLFSMTDTFKAYAFAPVQLESEQWVVLTLFNAQAKRTERGGKYLVPGYYLALPQQQFQQINYDLRYLLNTFPPVDFSNRLYKREETLNTLEVSFDPISWQNGLIQLWSNLQNYRRQLEALLTCVFHPPVYIHGFSGGTKARLQICLLLHSLVPIGLRPYISFTTATLGSYQRGPYVRFIEDLEHWTQGGSTLDWENSKARIPNLNRFAKLYSHDVIDALASGEYAELEQMSKIDIASGEKMPDSQSDWVHLAEELCHQWRALCSVRTLKQHAQGNPDNLTAVDWMRLHDADKIDVPEWLEFAAFELILATIRQQQESSEIQQEYRSTLNSLLHAMNEQQREELLTQLSPQIGDPTIFVLALSWLQHQQPAEVSKWFWTLVLQNLAQYTEIKELNPCVVELWKTIEIQLPPAQRQSWQNQLLDLLLPLIATRDDARHVINWILMDVDLNQELLRDVAKKIVPILQNFDFTATTDFFHRLLEHQAIRPITGATLLDELQQIVSVFKLFWFAHEVDLLEFVSEPNLYWLSDCLYGSTNDECKIWGSEQGKVILQWFVQSFWQQSEQSDASQIEYKLLGLAYASANQKLEAIQYKRWKTFWTEQYPSENYLQLFFEQIFALAEHDKLEPDVALLRTWLYGLKQLCLTDDVQFDENWKKLFQHRASDWRQALLELIDKDKDIFDIFAFRCLNLVVNDLPALDRYKAIMYTGLQHSCTEWIQHGGHKLQIAQFAQILGEQQARMALIEWFKTKGLNHLSNSPHNQKTEVFTRATKLFSNTYQTLGMETENFNEIIYLLLSESLREEPMQFELTIKEIASIAPDTSVILTSIMGNPVQLSSEQGHVSLHWLFSQHIVHDSNLHVNSSSGLEKQLMYVLDRGVSLSAKAQLNRTREFLQEWKELHNPESQPTIRLLTACGSELLDRQATSTTSLHFALEILRCLFIDQFRIGSQMYYAFSKFIEGSEPEELQNFVNFLKKLYTLGAGNTRLRQQTSLVAAKCMGDLAKTTNIFEHQEETIWRSVLDQIVQLLEVLNPDVLIRDWMSHLIGEGYPVSTTITIESMNFKSESLSFALNKITTIPIQRKYCVEQFKAVLCLAEARQCDRPTQIRLQAKMVEILRLYKDEINISRNIIYWLRRSGELDDALCLDLLVQHAWTEQEAWDDVHAILYRNIEKVKSGSLSVHDCLIMIKRVELPSRLGVILHGLVYLSIYSDSFIEEMWSKIIRSGKESAVEDLYLQLSNFWRQALDDFQDFNSDTTQYLVRTAIQLLLRQKLTEPCLQLVGGLLLSSYQQSSASFWREYKLLRNIYIKELNQFNKRIQANFQEDFYGRLEETLDEIIDNSNSTSQKLKEISRDFATHAIHQREQRILQRLRKRSAKLHKKRTKKR